MPILVDSVSAWLVLVYAIWVLGYDIPWAYRLWRLNPPHLQPFKYRFLEKKVERKSISSTGERHGSRIAIHSDMLTGMKPLSCDTCAKNSRNTILAGYNRTMAEWAAHISHYPCGQPRPTSASPSSRNVAKR